MFELHRYISACYSVGSVIQCYVSSLDEVCQHHCVTRFFWILPFRLHLPVILLESFQYALHSSRISLICSVVFNSCNRCLSRKYFVSLGCDVIVWVCIIYFFSSTIIFLACDFIPSACALISFFCIIISFFCASIF